MPDDVGVAAALAGLQHVRAVDRGVRGGMVRAFLSEDDMLPKVGLVALALLGTFVAFTGIGGVVLVVGLALLAVVPASIARERGRHSLSWYLYGLLLMPVAVGHALMLPTGRQAKEMPSGDRQLKALVGAATALFITIGLGLISTEFAAADTASEHDEGAAAAEDLIAGGVEVREWVFEYCQGMGQEGRSGSWVQGCEAVAETHPAVHDLGE